MPTTIMEYIDRFFSFDLFITRDLIALIYALGATLITVMAISTAIWGRVWTPSSSFGEVLFSAGGILIIGNLAWRVLCEYIVVLFRVNDSLISIDGKIQGP